MSQEKVLFANKDWKLIKVSTMSKDNKKQHFDQTEDMLFKSAIKHRCNYAGVRSTNPHSGIINTRGVKKEEPVYLDEEDTVTGKCWWCMTAVPEDVNALWKLQNWDVIPKVLISNAWHEDEVKSRFREIAAIDKRRKDNDKS